jgi:hypothetical protein
MVKHMPQKKGHISGLFLYIERPVIAGPRLALSAKRAADGTVELPWIGPL